MIKFKLIVEGYHLLIRILFLILPNLLLVLIIYCNSKDVFRVKTDKRKMNEKKEFKCCFTVYWNVFIFNLYVFM